MPAMPAISIGVGIVLSVYGLYSFSISESHGPTALFPAYFGMAFIGLGVLSMYEKFRKHAMHLAAVLGLIGFAGGAYMGIRKLPALLAGELTDPKDLNKARSQNLLAFICLIFVVLCVNSFIQARRRRKAEAAAPNPNPNPNS